MARSFTRSQLHTRARFHANLEGTNVGVLDSRVNELLDVHKLAVFHELTKAGAPDYANKDQAYVTAAGQIAYPLPDDFFKATTLLRQVNPPTSLNYGMVPVHQMSDHERGLYQPPQGAYNLTLEYIPVPPIWVGTDTTYDGSSFDGIAGYEELVCKLTARDLLARESRERMELNAECMRLLGEIRSTAKRSKGPHPITDVNLEEDEFWNGFFQAVNTVRAWRVRGQNIEFYERRVRP